MYDAIDQFGNVQQYQKDETEGDPINKCPPDWKKV